jgi:hypothetical protein
MLPVFYEYMQITFLTLSLSLPNSSFLLRSVKNYCSALSFKVTATGLRVIPSNYAVHPE